MVNPILKIKIVLSTNTPVYLVYDRDQLDYFHCPTVMVLNRNLTRTRAIVFTEKIPHRKALLLLYMIPIKHQVQVENLLDFLSRVENIPRALSMDTMDCIKMKFQYAMNFQMHWYLYLE